MKLPRQATILAISAILGFLLVSRFLLLSQIPATLTHDELVYAIQAKSLALQGTTWDGTKGWFKLQPIDPMYAEWPASVIAPGFWLTDNPLLAAHFVPALFGILIPFLLGSLAWMWWRNMQLTMWTLAVAACNPFLWQFSRLGYDASFATFFFLAGAVLLLSRSKLWVILSIPLFVLGFFQYQAFKLLLPPWVFGVIAIDILAKLEKSELPSSYKQVVSFGVKLLRERTYQFLVLGVSVFIMLAFAVVLLPMQDTGDRLQHMIWNQTEYLQQETDLQRRLSFSHSGTQLVSNKVTVIVSYMLGHLAGVFDPHRFFTNMDPRVNGFAAWKHGMFYAIDAVLLGLGVFWLLSKKKFQLSMVALLGLMIVLSVPAIINTQSQWYELRAFLMAVLVCIPVAAGFVQLQAWKKLLWIVCGIYVASVSVFAIHYFTQYPLYSADTARIIERILARYIVLHKENTPEQNIVVVATTPSERLYFFAAFLLYSGEFTQENAAAIRETVLSENWEYKNLQIPIKCIPPRAINPDTTLVYASDAKVCGGSPEEEMANSVLLPTTFLVLPAITDSGSVLRIHNDTVCGAYSLRRYVSPQSLSELRFEELTQREFCEGWVGDQLQN